MPVLGTVIGQENPASQSDLGRPPDYVRDFFKQFLDAGGQLVDRLVAFDLDLLGQVAFGRRADDLQKAIDLVADDFGPLAFDFGELSFLLDLFLLALSFRLRLPTLGLGPFLLGLILALRRILTTPSTKCGTLALPGNPRKQGNNSR